MMDWLTRLGLRKVLWEWQRGERSLDELVEWVEERILRGVTTQPAPTPDQIVPPLASG